MMLLHWWALYWPVDQWRFWKIKRSHAVPCHAKCRKCFYTCELRNCSENRKLCTEKMSWKMMPRKEKTNSTSTKYRTTTSLVNSNHSSQRYSDFKNGNVTAATISRVVLHWIKTCLICSSRSPDILIAAFNTVWQNTCVQSLTSGTVPHLRWRSMIAHYESWCSILHCIVARGKADDRASR